MLLFLVTRPTSPLHFEESPSCFLFTLDPVSQVAGVSSVQAFLIHERTCRQSQMDGEQEFYLEEEEFGKNRNNKQTNKKNPTSSRHCAQSNNALKRTTRGLSGLLFRVSATLRTGSAYCFFLGGGASSIFYHN